MLDHRNVPELAARHSLHDFGDRFIAAAGHDLAGHHLGDGYAKHRGPFLIERPDDIALRNDPDDAVISAGDKQRTDSPPRKNLHSLRQCRGRFDGEDVVTFLRKYVVDCHRQPPCVPCFAYAFPRGLRTPLPQVIFRLSEWIGNTERGDKRRLVMRWNDAAHPPHPYY